MGAASSQFTDSLELANALKTLERDYPQVPKNNEQSIVKGLRGGAAVLMVAAFEFFLRKLFEENISRLNTIPPSIDFSKLPDNLKVKTVFDGLKRAMEGPKYQQKQEKVDRIGDILSAGKLLINEHINPETFSDTGSNPNSETVKQKFKDVGISNIFGAIKTKFEKNWGDVVSQTFIADKLDEIVRTRHVVAHTADTLNISRKSQNESFKFLKLLVDLLEKELERHINDLITVAKK
jgi:hypothetical protein